MNAVMPGASLRIEHLTKRFGAVTAVDDVSFDVAAGQFVVLRFTNADPVFHDWEVDGLANVDAGARPGQTQRIRFRIDRPGTYRIVCTVDGHAEAGMAGTLVVSP